IADIVNGYASARFGGPVAGAKDSQEVVIQKPRTADLTLLMADIENLIVETVAAFLVAGFIENRACLVGVKFGELARVCLV
ncbi:hypothetical protein AB9F35_36155, partial [Rhizobium leguminosarum]